MNQNFCDEMPELISLYLDDDLDEVGRGRVRRHVVQCAECGPLFVEMQAVDTLFKNAPVQYAPTGFTDRAVNAAFQAAFQENLRLGLVTLLLGASSLLGLVLLGNLGIFFQVFSTIFAPGAFSGSQLWIPGIIEAWQVLVRVGFSLLVSTSQALAAPLIISLLGGIASFFILNEVMKRTRSQNTLSM